MKKGLSLTELIVLLAIVSLLIAVAIPSYRQYKQRSKVSSAFATIQKQLDVWTETKTLGQNMPETITNPSPYVASIEFNSTGVVASLIASELKFLSNDLQVTYTATIDGNLTSWTCTYASTVDYSKYLQDQSCSCVGC